MSGGILRNTIGSLRFRLFLTAWILFAVTFATDIVREHYPAMALALDGTYRLDRYKTPGLPGETREQAGLHSDIFWHGGHAYINNNVGTSVIAALPLFLASPVLRALEARSKAALARGGGPPVTSFDPVHPNRDRFFRLARENGWDLMFGAVAAITAAFLMAPLSALFVLLVFDWLAARGVARGRAILLAMLFGFGTPLLFRTAHLNHNMMVMYGAFGAFLVLVPGASAFGPPASAGTCLRFLPRPGARRHLAAGLLGGAAVMCDYSGVVPLLFLGLWVLAGWIQRRRSMPAKAGGPDGRQPSGLTWGVDLLAFAAGAAFPILVQLHSQWVCFGDWFRPPQAWMSESHFSDRGYHGLAWPAPDLFWDNLAEPRWGLFAFGPLLLLGLIPPRRNDASAPLPFRAWAWIMACAFGFMVFAASNQFGRMQWNTGVRYLMPVVPFFFLAAANHLRRLNGPLLGLVSVAAVLHSWVISMRVLPVESLEKGLGVGEAWRLFLTQGPRLKWLEVLSRATGRASIPAGAAAHVAVITVALLLVLLLWAGGRRLGRTGATSTTRPRA